MISSSLFVLAHAIIAIANPLGTHEPTATTSVSEELRQQEPTPSAKYMDVELRDLAMTTTLGVRCTVTKVVGNPIQGDLTLTKFPSTVTSTAATDCHGCKLSVVSRSVITLEPVKYTKTVTAPDPATEYSWVCLPTGLAE
ncbi:hypothetical protein F5883DRAFT_638848 [Diaporthe sp. PMI_573]|nr:hypothetical protein F5883DRAFT_638848 [Diaporthaceae sp. PMI_573]